MVSELKGGETVLTGVLEDRAALFGVLAQIEALGLDLLEIRQVTAHRHRPESDALIASRRDHQDPAMSPSPAPGLRCDA